MHKCKEMWKSVADFLINKLGGMTKEEYEAMLLKERNVVHLERIPVQTATIEATAKLTQPIGSYARRCLAERIGLTLLEEGLLRFDFSVEHDYERMENVYFGRAIARVVAPSSQGFGNEVEGFFIDHI